jgi:DNA-binding SARP family transcriptional activator
VQVRLLGPVDVTVDGAARPLLGLRRKAVLAVLGLRPGATVSADHLIEVVWGDEPPVDVTNALQSHVSYLRGVLGARPAIAARKPGYVLDLGDDATDLLRAERLIARGRQATDPADAARHLRAALALWRGRPLADVDALVWLQRQADRLAELHPDAVRLLIEARLVLGEHTRLVPELEHLVHQHPSTST